MLEKDFKYYIQNQAELIKKHYGRFIIIKDQKVLGDFSSETDAIVYAKKDLHLPLGTFLIQQCSPGQESYTQFFHSRVMFIS
jgi:hypothetical protein